MVPSTYMILHRILRAEYPRMTEWFDEIYTTPMIQSITSPLRMLDVTVPALLMG